MDYRQAVPSPRGVSVFGSALIRVVPDVAVLQLAANGLDEQPESAFSQVRSKVDAVHAFLRQADAREVASSRVTLRQEFRFIDGRPQPIGYRARVAFQIKLRDLQQVELILVGAVGAGANEVVAVDFQTTALRAHRLEARKRAVLAAHEKASAYCEAANASVGAVLHIEDVNPDVLTGVREGHVHHQMPVDDGDAHGIFDPGAITVGAAVIVVYSLASQQV